jgi:hypothetical protein
LQGEGHGIAGTTFCVRPVPNDSTQWEIRAEPAVFFAASMAGTQTQMLPVALPRPPLGFGTGHPNGGVRVVTRTCRKLQQLDFG